MPSMASITITSNAILFHFFEACDENKTYISFHSYYEDQSWIGMKVEHAEANHFSQMARLLVNKFPRRTLGTFGFPIGFKKDRKVDPMLATTKLPHGNPKWQTNRPLLCKISTSASLNAGRCRWNRGMGLYIYICIFIRFLIWRNVASENQR